MSQCSSRRPAFSLLRLSLAAFSWLFGTEVPVRSFHRALRSRQLKGCQVFRTLSENASPQDQPRWPCVEVLTHHRHVAQLNDHRFSPAVKPAPFFLHCSLNLRNHFGSARQGRKWKQPNVRSPSPILLLELSISPDLIAHLTCAPPCLSRPPVRCLLLSFPFSKEAASSPIDGTMAPPDNPTL